MVPNLPIATDNIYKFACLFGLAMIIVSILSFVTVYSSTLDRKVKLSEAIIPLEAKETLTKAEQQTLELNRKLIEVAKGNERTAHSAIGGTFAVGLMLSIYGARRWRTTIQARDDLLATLQIEKLRAEIAKLVLETDRLRNVADGSPRQQNVTTGNDG
ncbi:hypothetical protein [Aromatoleum petrolei]|uniref:Transmembrane protein n=1 Tax=Aromatoleum petrolei TaxID=76116 RepID=A0ABX1MKK3_9RHOO|nr:hypothetical protein [Aromatoleum petrolei]NMF88263.1 hypothetical protein [Aromatoleum petrolei]QTQ38037.1 Uncharacterized protein ToN1_39320 [Aromatoleum petrolei]